MVKCISCILDNITVQLVVKGQYFLWTRNFVENYLCPWFHVTWGINLLQRDSLVREAENKVCSKFGVIISRMFKLILDQSHKGVCMFVRQVSRGSVYFDFLTLLSHIRQHCNCTQNSMESYTQKSFIVCTLLDELYIKENSWLNLVM